MIAVLQRVCWNDMSLESAAAKLATEEELRRLHSFFGKKGIGKHRRAEAIGIVESRLPKNYIRRHPPASSHQIVLIQQLVKRRVPRRCAREYRPGRGAFTTGL